MENQHKMPILQTISSDDFSRTVIIMLIGIGIILIVITRSIMQPIFIIGSLLLTYWSSLGLGEWISKQVLGVDLLSWNVPFFSFIMIVALGVDYSIFLMMRYREQENSTECDCRSGQAHWWCRHFCSNHIRWHFCSINAIWGYYINSSCHRSNHWTLLIKLCDVTNLDSGLTKFTVFIDSYLIKKSQCYIIQAIHLRRCNILHGSK